MRSNTNRKIWVKKSRDVETNEDISNSTCKNEHANDIENSSMTNDDFSFKKSVSKCFKDDKSSDCPSLHSQSAIQDVEIKILEHAIEDFLK